MNIRNTEGYQQIITGLESCINEISSLGDGRTEDDLRLINRVFNAAKLREDLYQHLGEVIAWQRQEPVNDPGRAERVIKVLDFLTEKKCFTAAIVLLLIEAERQLQLEKKERNPECANIICEYVSKRCREESWTVSLNDIFSPVFVAFWLEKLFSAFQSDVLWWIKEIFSESDPFDLYEVFEIRCKEKNIDELSLLIDVAFTLEPGNVRKTAFRIISSALEDLGPDKKVQSVKDRMPAESETIKEDGNLLYGDAKSKSYTLYCRISDLLRDNQLDEALELAEKIEDINFQVMTYSNIARYLAENGSIEHAGNLFERAYTIAGMHENLCDRGGLYRRIAEDLSGSGFTEWAHHMIDNALVSVLKSVDLLSKYLQLENIVKVVAEFGQIERAAALTDLIENPEIKIRALSIIVPKDNPEGRIRLQFEEAVPKASYEENPGTAVEALTDMAVKFAACGNRKKAKKLFHCAYALSQIDDTYHNRSRLLGTIAEKEAAAGEIDRAVGRAYQCSTEWFTFKALGRIAYAVAESGNIDRAVSIAENIEESYIKTKTYCSIAEQLLKTGKRADAESMQHRAESAAGGIDCVPFQDMADDSLAELREKLKSEKPIAAESTEEDCLPAFYDFVFEKMSDKEASAFSESSAIQNQDPLNFLRRTAAFFTFDKISAFNFAYSFLHELLTAGKENAFYTIIREIPALDLGFLLE